MEFTEGTIPEQKTFGAIVFPKTLLPPQDDDTCTDNMLVEMVKEKEEWLCQVLERHSAILFRGFRVGSGEEFGYVVDAFGWEDMRYFGFTSRNKVVDQVFTANEAPLDKPFGFHHEMSTVKEYPSKVIFFCAEPSPKGGETSILPANIILEKMEETLPEFVSKLRRLGYVFQTKTAKEDETSNAISKTWKWIFTTDDKLEAELRGKEKLGCTSVKFNKDESIKFVFGQLEAEKRAKEKLECTSVRFNEDGSAEFVHGPVDPIKRFGKKRVWFHHIVGRNEGDTDSFFGDGTPIPRSALDNYRKIINENCVDIKWQKGDVLLVDNLSAQHARRAGKAPRQILVSICK